MRVITWNVNSIRQRLPRLLALLERHEPDVVLLQETKTVDPEFPFGDLMAAGYEAVSYGQKSYNGVAMLSKEPITDEARGFPDDPVDGESRVLSATTGGIRFVDTYVVNGKRVGDPAYDVKLAWLDALRVYLAEMLVEGLPVLVAGDFNVAPEDRDVHDPALWQGKNLASEPERERIRGIEALGFTDLGRAVGDTDEPGPFTWWDYRMGAFHRGWGLRIDLLLGSPEITARLEGVDVDREERKPTAGEGKPSDHAPVILTLNDNTG